MSCLSFSFVPLLLYVFSYLREKIFQGSILIWEKWLSFTVIFQIFWMWYKLIIIFKASWNDDITFRVEYWHGVCDAFELFQIVHFSLFCFMCLFHRCLLCSLVCSVCSQLIQCMLGMTLHQFLRCGVARFGLILQLSNKC